MVVMENMVPKTRILVVNPNSNPAITRVIEAQACAVASSGTEILAVTAPFGPSSIESRAEAVVAAHAVLTAIARHCRYLDGVAIAAFSDPGLAAARELVTIPVAGIAEASVQAAASAGRCFSLITIGRHMESAIRHQIADYGCAAALLSVEFVEGSVLSLMNDRERFATDTAALAARAVDKGAEAVVLGGGPFSGMAETLSRTLSVPIFGGIEEAIRRIESLVHESVASPKWTGTASLVKPYPGIDPALADLLSASVASLRSGPGQ